jgi:hypothetical protein
VKGLFLVLRSLFLGFGRDALWDSNFFEVATSFFDSFKRSFAHELSFEADFSRQLAARDNFNFRVWGFDQTFVSESEVVDFAAQIIQTVGINNFSFVMETLETFKFRNGLHDGALATHEAGWHFAVTGAGFLTLSTTAGGFTFAGRDATTSTGWARIAINL